MITTYKVEEFLIIDFIHKYKAGSYKTVWSFLRNWITPVLGLTLFFIIIQQISLKEFLNVFTRANFGYLLIALVAGVSVTVIKTIRYYFFFPAPGRKIMLYGTFSILRVLYYVLPFNTGDIASLSILKKNKFSPTVSETAPAWIFLRLIDVIALTFWFLVVLNFNHLSGNLYLQMYSIRWMIIAIAVIVIALILLSPFIISRVNFNNKWISKHLDFLKAGVVRIYGVRVFFRSLVISIILWAVLISVNLLTQLTFNAPVTFAQSSLIAVTLYCISLLPINAPLNLGTEEGSWSLLLILSGVSAAEAISIAISIKIVSLMIILLDGMIGGTILITNKQGKPNGEKEKI